MSKYTDTMQSMKECDKYQGISLALDVQLHSSERRVRKSEAWSRNRSSTTLANDRPYGTSSYR